MKIKATGLMLVVAMVLSIVLPASANTDGDAGVFVGQAIVGKGGGCEGNAGDGDVSGGGLGLGDPRFPKSGHYEIHAPGSVTSVQYGQGSLDLCGPLLPLTANGTHVLGASCETTHSRDGQGVATFPGDPDDTTDDVQIWISDLGWTATVGALFVVTGRVGDAKGKATDLLVAEVVSLDDNVLTDCLSKNSADKSGDGDGATVFDVQAVYQIIPVLGEVDEALDTPYETVK